MTGEGTKLPPPQSHRKNNQENYRHLERATKARSSWDAAGEMPAQATGARPTWLLALSKTAKYWRMKTSPRIQRSPEAVGRFMPWKPLTQLSWFWRKGEESWRRGTDPAVTGRRGRSIKVPGPLRGTCKGGISWLVPGDLTLLGRGSACISCSLCCRFPGITRHDPGFLADAQTLTSASELRGLGRSQPP